MWHHDEDFQIYEKNNTKIFFDVKLFEYMFFLF